MSDNNPSVLLLSPYLPSLDTGGCARKVYDFISFFKQKGYSLNLLSFCSLDDKKRIGSIRKLCSVRLNVYLKNYSRYPLRCQELSQKISQLARSAEVDLIQCENSYLTRYIPPEVKIPCVLTEHEILSASFYERAKIEKNPFTKTVLYLRSIKKYCEEKNNYRKFDKIISFSKEDKEIIRRRQPSKDIEVIPLGVNLDEFQAPSPNGKYYDIIFAGNFSHFPNVDAVLYFYNRILPLVREKIPEVSFLIAGANPPEKFKQISRLDRNIKVSGYVADLRQLYRKARVSIAPVRFGTGMRMKIIESLALKVPVVSTLQGARGVFASKSLMIANNENEFANYLIDLLREPDSYLEFAQCCRQEAEIYSLERACERYETIFRSLLR